MAHKRYVTVSGCDASSYVVLELTAQQLKGIEMLAEKVNADDTTCSPGIMVQERTELNKWELGYFGEGED